MHSTGVINREMFGVFLVAVSLFVVEALFRLDISFTLAPVFVVLVYVTYATGLQTGLVGAAIISVYDLWRLWPDDVARAVIVGASCFAIAVMVGLLQRKAALIDTLNGNIARLKQAIEYLDSLLGGWDVMSNPERRERVRIVREHLSQLATLVIGWHRLAQEKADYLAREDTDL